MVATLENSRLGVIRKSEVLSALSFGLDLTEGQTPGHAIRSCVIGMYLGREIGLPQIQQSALYYALLMKDAGCSANSSKMARLLGSDDISAKRAVKTTDWTKVSWETVQYSLSHVRPGAPFLVRMRALFDLAVSRKRNARDIVQIRCERGASIARKIGLPEATAEAIYSLDELWNGMGHPYGLRGGEIPILARILNIAQSIEVFYTKYGAAAAVEIARKRSRKWFDPALVKAFLSVSKRNDVWRALENPSEAQKVFAPADDFLELDEPVIDNICQAFAEVIDAKSPFTYRHSNGVATAAVAIGRRLGKLSEVELTTLHRAALLHDIGKLSVSNTILDKPDKLNDQEWKVVRDHPHFSHEILRRVPAFEEISELAACHHEKLDGTGYFRNRTADQLSTSARILVVADIFDALAAKRPYRDALPLETVFSIMAKDAPRAIDADCFQALRECGCEAL